MENVGNTGMGLLNIARVHVVILDFVGEEVQLFNLEKTQNITSFLRMGHINTCVNVYPLLTQVIPLVECLDKSFLPFFK